MKGKNGHRMNGKFVAEDKFKVALKPVKQEDFLQNPNIHTVY